MSKIINWFKKQRFEWWIWGLFVVCTCVVMCVHEPWFDEIQAWQIAKTASWKDMLFVLPHLEGHPPFWHILLALPAKMGISWQIGLRGAGLLFGSVAAWLFIFKSPFPRWFRCVVPFSFFLFYQYTVVVRPYSIMMLLLFLLAVVFPSKNQRPGRFVGLLAALCACHLYGIAIAGGICCAWLWELKKGKTWHAFYAYLCQTRIFYYLLGLLVWAGVLVAWICPDANAVGVFFKPYSALWQRIVYVGFMLPADAVLTNIYHQIWQSLQFLHFEGPFFWTVVGIGGLLWVLVLGFLPRKYWGYLLLPYLFLGILLVYYCWRHHIGLWLLLVLFAGWIGWKDSALRPQQKWIRFLALGIVGVCVIMSLVWMGTAVFWDFSLHTFPEPELKTFLRKHNLLDNKVIIAGWSTDVKGIDQTHMIMYGTELSFYLGKNIITNFNVNSSKEYFVHKVQTASESAKEMQAWREKGVPDMLIGYVQLERLFEDRAMWPPYRIVFEAQRYDIWKNEKPNPRKDVFAVREDLLSQHQLVPLR